MFEQREIKYRVFISHHEVIRYCTGYEYYDDKITFYENKIRYTYFKVDCIVTQWTGLVDKHGKDIYEGDIVNKGTIVTIGKQSIEDSYGGILEYYGCNIEIGSGYPIPVKAEYEIIGNVFENPELLE